MIEYILCYATAFLLGMLAGLTIAWVGQVLIED